MANSANFSVKITADLKLIKAAFAGLKKEISGIKASIAKPGKINLGVAAARAEVKLLSQDLAKLKAQTNARSQINFDIQNARAQIKALSSDLAKLKAENSKGFTKVSFDTSQAKEQVKSLSSDFQRLKTGIARKTNVSLDVSRAVDQVRSLENRLSKISSIKPVRINFTTKVTDLGVIRREIVSTRNEANKTREAISRPPNVSKTQSAFRSIISDIRNLRTAFFTLESAAFLFKISDEAANLSARLKLATDTQEEFTRAQQATFDISQRTSVSLRTTIDTFARLERSTEQLGFSQERVLALTESINQAAVLSGGGVSTEAALNQLNQGLASGVLRGQELNSVMEQTPRIARAIADGMGVPIGRLRALAAEGKLTSEVVANALS